MPPFRIRHPNSSSQSNRKVVWWIYSVILGFLSLSRTSKHKMHSGLWANSHKWLNQIWVWCNHNSLFKTPHLDLWTSNNKTRLLSNCNSHRCLAGWIFKPLLKSSSNRCPRCRIKTCLVAWIWTWADSSKSTLSISLSSNSSFFSQWSFLIRTKELSQLRRIHCMTSMLRISV